MNKELKLQVTADTRKADKAYQDLIKKFEAATGKSLKSFANGLNANTVKITNQYREAGEKIRGGFVKIQKDVTNNEILEVSKRVSAQINGINKVRDAQKQRLSKTDQRIAGLSDNKRSTDLNSTNALKQQLKYWKDIRDAAARSSTEFQRADANVQKFSSSLKNSGKGLSVFQKLEVGENIATIGIGLGLVGAAAASAVTVITDLVGTVGSLIETGAGLSVLENSFVRLSGGTQQAAEKLSLLRQASAGNLDNQTLQIYANQMKSLDVSLDDTAKLLDLVERASDDVGVSFSTGNSALQSFIVTGRTGALKELSLNAGRVKDEMDRLTIATGKTTQELTAEELQTIRINAVLGLYGNSLGEIKNKQLDAGDQIASLKTGFKNVTDEILIFLSQAAQPVIAGMISIKEELLKQLSALGLNADAFESLKKSVIEIIEQGYSYLVQIYKSELIPAIVDLVSETKNLIATNPALISDLKTIAKTALDLVVAFDKLVISGLAKFISFISDAVAVTKPFFDLLDDIATTLRDINTLRFDKLIELFNTDHTVDVKVNTDDKPLKTLEQRVNEVTNRIVPTIEITADSNTTKRRVGNRSGRTSQRSAETETLDRVQRIVKDIAELENERNKSVILYGENSGIALEIISEIVDKQKELNRLQTEFINLQGKSPILENLSKSIQGFKEITGGFVNTTQGTPNATAQRQNPSEEPMTFVEFRDEFLSLFSESFSSLKNILSELNIGTNTAFSIMVQKALDIAGIFQDIVNFLNTVSQGVQLVKTFLSFIPGVGSIVGGGAAAAGVAGLISNGGKTPSLNSFQRTPVVNNFFKVDLNTLEIVKQGYPQYQDYKNSIRVT